MLDLIVFSLLFKLIDFSFFIDVVVKNVFKFIDFGLFISILVE